MTEQTEVTLARWWHVITAVAVVAGVGLAIGLGGSQAPDDIAAFPSRAMRSANVLAYFTIQSNIIVGITTLLLALRPRRTSLLFRVFRFDGVAMIVLTAAVYHALLAGLPPQPHGWNAVDNQLLHTVVPALAVLGWLVFGPRRLVSWEVVGLSLLYPVAWLAATLLRGAAIGWYPYDFMDPREQRYAGVWPTLAGIVVVFLALAVLLYAADYGLGRLARRRAAPLAD